MNIELDEVAVLDVSDDALELAAGGAQGGCVHTGFGDFTWAWLAIANSKPTPTWAWVLNFGIDMNIELDEVVVQDVTDDELEMAAGGQGGHCPCWQNTFSVDS
jgi:hypothetical protein